ARAVARTGFTPGAVVLAVAVPLIFLHIDYQLGVRVPLGSTHLGLELSDLAVVAVAVAAVYEGVRIGFAPLRPALWVWISLASLMLWIALRSQTLEHGVTAAKFAEYGLLAVSTPLVLRRRADWELVAAVIVAWSVVATSVGLLQIFGADIADAWAAGRRQPSFLGHSDFAALSALALGIGLAAVLLAGRRVGWVGLVSGALGVMLSGASAGLLGVLAGTAGLLAAIALRRRIAVRDLAISIATICVIAAGVTTLRAGDFEQFLKFVGVRSEQRANTGVQTYSHHTLLAYIGYEIWRDHPVAGAGWQATREPGAG